MQPHIHDAARSSASSVISSVTDRRSFERPWNSDFVVTRYVVVLNLGPVYRAELVNESTRGIAIQIRELDRLNCIGHSVDVIYRGKRYTAEIRRVSDSDNGYVIGLEWKKGYAE